MAWRLDGVFVVRRGSSHRRVPVIRCLLCLACPFPLGSLLLAMQVDTPKPMDGCQNRLDSPPTRPAALDSMASTGPPSQLYPSDLYQGISLLSNVCEQVSSTPNHPLGLSAPTTLAPGLTRPRDSLMALPLAHVAGGPADVDQAVWAGFTAGQALKPAGSSSQIPPSSPISPPVVMHCPPGPACFGPQLLGVAANAGSVLTPPASTVPDGGLTAAGAPITPSPPRRRPRRRADGPAGKAAKSRSKARASGRKASPGSSTSSLGSEADAPASPLPTAEVAAGRRKPAAAAGAPTHTCKVPGCNRAFARTYNLSTHMRTHTGDCPYACEDKSCAKKFKWKSSLTSHRKFHEKREAEARAAAAAAAASSGAATIASAAAEAEMSTAESTENEAAVAGVAMAAAPLVGGVLPLVPGELVQAREAQVVEAEMAATALAKLRLEGLAGRLGSV